VKGFSSNPSAALYVIASALFIGALLAFLFIPKNFSIQPGTPRK
jgi:hypothetical protein